jgi:hypothetical protein
VQIKPCSGNTVKEKLSEANPVSVEVREPDGIGESETVKEKLSEDNPVSVKVKEPEELGESGDEGTSPSSIFPSWLSVVPSCPVKLIA